MNQPKLSIVLVTWNGERFIRPCLTSVFEQTWIKNHDDFNVLVLDNGSTDKTVEILNDYIDKIKVVYSKQNIGFAKGYNKGIHWTNGNYVLLLNQDVILDKKYLEEAMNFLDEYPEVGVVTGKVLRWDFDNQRRTNIIDTLGLKLKRNMQVMNIAEGERDDSTLQEIKPVFGFSGSVFLIRRTALMDIAYEQQFFDEDFFSYKEDVDLSWRLRYRNWDIVYVPSVVAYHKRSVQDKTGDRTANLQVAVRYQQKPKFINYLSYRNHLYVLFKNVPFDILRKNFFPIMWYEFKKFVFLLFRFPSFLKAWPELFGNFRFIRKKRSYIMQHRKINPSGLQVWLKR